MKSDKGNYLFIFYFKLYLDLVFRFFVVVIMCVVCVDVFLGMNMLGKLWVFYVNNICVLSLFCFRFIWNF